MYRVQISNFMKEQGRILVAILALLCASMASADATSGREAGPQIPWKLSEPFRLPKVTVSVNANVPNPTYFMRLPNGDVLELPPTATANTKGLSKAELAGAAYDTRDVLEGVARLMLSGVNTPSAIIQANYAIANVLTPIWSNSSAATFNPIASVLQGEVTATPSRRPLIRERIRKIMAAIKDATYTSAIAAWKEDRKAVKALGGPWKERGFQVGLRVDIQVGIGKFNFTKNFPVMLSFGYNRDRRTIVFRHGFRHEAMEAGTAFQVGARVEFRFYSLHSYESLALDPRPQFSKVKGKSWYPPSIPFIAPVLDYAPGFVSRGLTFGGNISSVILPQSIFLDVGLSAMNTVVDFQETQREYSAELSDAPEWMKQFHQKITETTANARTSARAVKCEMLFSESAGRYMGRGI